jgi:hypothetical protein
MIVLKKQPKKDFIILNITDPQLGDPEWAEGHSNRKILEYTVAELIQRTQPDLITVSGDLAWAGYNHAYIMFANLLEKFGIPWAPVWGNHDNQNGAEHIEYVIEKYSAYPHFLYEKGEPALGNGNYVICIEEEGKTVEALIMMDSHDKAPYVDAEGNEQQAWAKLLPEQISWYKEQAELIKARGCTDSTLILHIPIYAYLTASQAAYKDGLELSKVSLEESYDGRCWKDGYTDSVGVQHEGIACYPAEDGVFTAIQESGITKRVIAGHDHVNNFMIRHEGIQLIYALKTGEGCYWEPTLNGGTVLKVNENGVYEVKHEYVDVSHIK